jgi:hypothetical protein
VGVGQARHQTPTPRPTVQVMPMRTTCPQLNGVLCNTLWRTSKCCFLTHTHHSRALDTHVGCRNPHEHWRGRKTDQHVYIYIRVNQIDIYIQVFVGMLSAFYVEALSKNNGLVGQLCLKANVHAGIHLHSCVSRTRKTWTNRVHFWTVYTLLRTNTWNTKTNSVLNANA